MGFASSVSAQGGAAIDIVVHAGVARGIPIASDVGTASGTTTAIAGVDIETRHVSIAKSWDLAFDGAFSRGPLFSMTKAAPSSLPSYTGGFATSFAFRVARAFSSSSELALVGRAGLTRIDDAANAAANAVGPAAAFYDAKADFRWLGQMLLPLLEGYVGLRHDQRFHRAGDLSGFDDPTGRVIAGIAVNAIRIRDRGTDAHGGATLVAIGAEFDLERALRGTMQLPSGYIAMLRADIDIATAMRHR